MTNTDLLFDTPLQVKKVRKNVKAYQYRNGTIEIAGVKYLYYSMTDAIKLWRKQNPIK